MIERRNFHDVVENQHALPRCGHSEASQDDEFDHVMTQSHSPNSWLKSTKAAILRQDESRPGSEIFVVTAEVPRGKLACLRSSLQHAALVSLSRDLPSSE